MAVPITILPKQEDSLATGIGSGLGSILQGLAAGKVRQMQQQQGMQALQNMGQAPEQAQGLMDLFQSNPQLAMQFLKSQQLQQSQAQKQQQAQEKIAIDTNKPFTQELRKASVPAKKLKSLSDRAIELTQKLKTLETGPAGNLPAITEAAGELDSVLNEILLDKAAFEGTGQRGTKMYLALQQAAKPHRGMRKNVLLKRLEDIRQEAQKTLTTQDIADQVLDANEGRQPVGFETIVKNVRKISKRLPEADRVEDGSVYQEGGYQFKLSDGKWVYQGKGAQ